MKKVGFIGLGIMGYPMARNLLKAGTELMVKDLVKENEERLIKEGATTADYSLIGRCCDLVFIMLPTGEDVRHVIFGESGLVSTMKENSVICDMSSVTPDDSRLCYSQLKKKNIGFMDAPVSGGEPKAIDGTLAFMVGGDEDIFNLLLPYFNIMGASAILVGDTGSGSIAKLANQVIVNLNIAAISEAFVLAEKAGADTEKVFEAIRGGLAGSRVLEDKIPKIIARDFEPGGKISINSKDIRNVLNTASSIDVPVPLSAQLFQIMQALKVDGYSNYDHCGIVRHFEKLAGVEVKGGRNDK